MEKIHVTVRARPLSHEEAKTSPWQIHGNSIFFTNQSLKFDFDQILGENCKNVEVYQCRTEKIVSAAVRGFNGTVFAYGQTNSGKTYTMRGSTSEPGVIPLAVRDLFKTIQEDMDREFLLRMSYMEIYNEEINDLLAPEHRKLQIHENTERGIYVAGLREEIVASPEQVLDLMEFGESHRHIGETNMNLHSSRSHTIFRMIIESRDRREDDSAGSPCDAVRVSVLNLVDLAGSERAAKTGAEGVRLKEGSHINKSLMTLGTVIKKLSEGAESQGGHVPYRDSKLTRILQPALGGNANTAIICNITLAQIHTDETKSSLQFASRALRVTNCACVNEILTDAALLKRQKKEIEQLRAKLQDSHSEHFEEEILNLRNKLLQTELERIAMELEEEKKAQAEKERKLQEQAKKIENLSSMVLNSNRDDDRDHHKKEKRRDTWCPGNLLRGIPSEDCPTTQSKASAVKSTRPRRNMKPLVPFDELEDEGPLTLKECSSGNKGLEDCSLPDPRALLHVTNRRKGPVKKKSLVVENKELVDMQGEYEELFLTLETERTISEVKVDCLLQNLAEANLPSEDCNLMSRDTEAMLMIKRLEEQIRVLETEKSSSLQNLDSAAELATEQTICGRDKYEELLQELLNARKESTMAREQLIISKEVDEEEDLESLTKLLLNVQEILSEIQGSKDHFKDVSSLVHELLEYFSVSVKTFSEFKSLMCQSTVQHKSTISKYEKVHRYMNHKLTELEDEKLCLRNQSADLYKQIEELKLKAENSEKVFNELVEQHDLEKSELLTHFQILENEISSLSSSSLARENGSLRKDLDKMKTKLKDTESKLKNVIQEKTKLEGEKAFVEREIKQLHGQKSFLERETNKRESLAGRRRESTIDRSSKVFDPKKGKGYAVPFETVQDYKNLEVLAFEMEATIASLEEQLAAAQGEKEEAINNKESLAMEATIASLEEQLAAAQGEKEEAINNKESLAMELESMLGKLNTLESELFAKQEEVSSLSCKLEESNSCHQKSDNLINMLVDEKEEMATQLANALLEMEEEKAIWSAKEKASIEAMEDKAKSYSAEVLLLTNRMLEVRNELESYKEKCKMLEERLMCCEESMDKSLEIDQLREALKIADDERKRSETLRSSFETLSLEHRLAGAEVVRLQKEMLEAKDQVEKLTRLTSNMEAKAHKDEVHSQKETAKVRMRLHWTDVKLNAVTERYKEALKEGDLMHKNFEEAAAKLKEKLSSSLIENLKLKKQHAANK